MPLRFNHICDSMKYVLCLSLLFLVLSCGKDPETTKPEIRDISSSVYASGTIKSKDQYQVYPLVSGIIREIYVDDGDRVAKGQLLMRIDNRTQQLTKENAALLASYNSVQENTDRLNEAKDAIALSKDKLKTDSLLYVRTKTLYNQGAASGVELEQRELAYESSRNAYQSAKTRYKDLQRQITINAKQAQNNLAISAKTEEDFLIRSDLSGTIYSVLKEQGELVSPQMPVAVVGAADQFVLEMEVDEYDIAKIERGQKVFVTMDSYKGQVFEAKVTKVSPIMNERSKTFTVEAIFTKTPPKVFPNTSFEASIVLQSKSKAMVIPKRYLLAGDKVLLSDGRKVAVKTGLRDYEFVEILSGISATDELMMEE